MCGGNGVDQIDACELCGAVMRGEREECAAKDGGYAAENEPGPAVGGVANAVANGEGAGGGDDTVRRVELREENPNVLNRVAEYVVITPLELEI